jgi:hypothetical protein
MRRFVGKFFANRRFMTTVTQKLESQRAEVFQTLFFSFGFGVLSSIAFNEFTKKKEIKETEEQQSIFL